jgi:hypothetical protein
MEHQGPGYQWDPQCQARGQLGHHQDNAHEEPPRRQRTEIKTDVMTTYITRDVETGQVPNSVGSTTCIQFEQVLLKIRPSLHLPSDGLSRWV